MKKSLFFLFVFILSLSITLSGCIFQGDPTVATLNNGGNPTATNSYIGDENHMYIWWDSRPELTNILNTAIVEFQESNLQGEGYTIEGYTPPSISRNALEIAIKGGTPPALVKMDSPSLATLSAKGDIEDLNDPKYNFAQHEEKFIPSTWKAVQHKGKIFGVPFDANLMTVVYNKELLSEVNSEVPTTFNEFIDVTTAIKNLGRENTYAAAYEYSDYGGSYVNDLTFIQMLLALGGNVLNEDNTKATINQQPGIDALTIIRDGVNEGYIVLSRDSNKSKEDQVSSGNAAMTVTGQWYLPKAENNKNIGFAPPLKSSEDATSYSLMGLYALGVISEAAGNSHTDLAYDFAVYLGTNQQYTRDYSKAMYSIPALEKASKDEFFNGENYEVFTAQMKDTRTIPYVESWPPIEEAINYAIYEVLDNNVPVDKALNDAANRINQLLDEENNPESTTK